MISEDNAACRKSNTAKTPGTGGSTDKCCKNTL